ncbi:hypothetical protein DYB37_012805, partial [Aphanomyces astaci]
MNVSPGGRSESFPDPTGLVEFIAKMRARERALTTTHIINRIKRFQPDWLRLYLADKEPGMAYQSLLPMIQPAIVMGTLGNALATPRTATPTGATKLPSVPDDDDMGEGDERGFVYNAPAIPDPPSFNGSTKSERRSFIPQYKKYLDQVNALQLNGSRPFVMPVSAYMDVFTKKRVAMWDMANRDYRGVTEAEWASWFSKVFEEEPQDLDVLKNFDIMVKAIKPLGLQKSVQRHQALQRNKPLKSNVYRFVDWLRVHTAGYHLYAPVEDDKTSAPPATVAAAPSRPSKPERSEGSVGSSSRPPRRAPAPEQDSAKYERKKATCLKCDSANHKVVNCPKCAPGESERLLKEQMDKWKSALNKKVAKLQGITNKSLRLRSQDRMHLKVISPEPSVIQQYSQAPALKVDRQVQFTLVTLDTHCGPLALRGLKAWVDSSSNAAELLISRAVRERLGFSENELL